MRGRVEIGGTLDRYRRSRGRLSRFALELDVERILQDARRALDADLDYSIDAWHLDEHGARISLALAQGGSLSFRVRPEPQGRDLLLVVHDVVALCPGEAPSFAHAMEATRRVCEHPTLSSALDGHGASFSTAALRLDLGDLVAAGAFLGRRWKLPSRLALSIAEVETERRLWRVSAHDGASGAPASPLFKSLAAAERGDDSAMLGQRGEAAEAYRALLREHGDTPDIMLRLLDVLLTQRSPAALAEARALAGRFIEPWRSAHADARVTRAEGGDPAPALRSLAELAPDPVVATQARCALALALTEVAPDEAVSAARASIVRSPRHPAAWATYVSVARAVGDVSALEDALKRADDVAISDTTRIEGLAELVALLDRGEDVRPSTLSFAESWAAAAPESAEAARHRARALDRCGHTAEAAAAIQRAAALALDSEEVALLLDVADDLARVCGAPEARSLRHAATRTLQTGWLGLRQVDALRALGDEGGAQRLLDTVERHAEDPRLARAARSARAAEASNAGQANTPPADASVPAAPRAPTPAPQRDVSGRPEGEVEALKAAVGKAADDRERAAALTSLAAALPSEERAATLVALGELLYFELESEEEAFAPLSEAFAEEPDAFTYGALSALEDLAGRRGDHQLLVRVYERKLDETSDPKMRSVFRLTMAETLANVDPEAARALTDEVLRQTPGHPPALRVHARVLEGLGDMVAAVAALESALASVELDDIERVDVWREIARLDPTGPAGERANQALLESYPGDAQAVGALKRSYAARMAWPDYLGVLRSEAAILLGREDDAGEDEASWWREVAASEVAAALSGTLAGVLREVASVYGGPLDEPGLACDVLRSALALGDEDPEFLDAFVWAAREAGDDEALIEGLERLAPFLLPAEQARARQEAAALRDKSGPVRENSSGDDTLERLDAIARDGGPLAGLRALSDWLPTAREPALRRELLVRKGAWTLASAEDPREALLPLKGALILAPEALTTRAHLLTAYALANDGTAAMAQWREICALAPESVTDTDAHALSEAVALWLTRGCYPGREAVVHGATPALAALIPDL